MDSGNKGHLLLRCETESPTSNSFELENSPNSSISYPEETKELVKDTDKPGFNAEAGNPYENPGTKSNRKEKCLKLLMVVAGMMLGINVVLNSVTFVLQNQTPREDRVLEKLDESICLPCVQLVENPFDPRGPDSLTDRLDRRVKDGVQMCCAGNEDQMSAMMEAALRDQEVRPVPDLSASDLGLELTPVSAHLHLRAGPREQLLTNQADSRGSSKKTHITAQFATNQHRSFSEHASGVTVLPAALQIQHAGLYYLYLSVLTTPGPGDFSEHNRHKDWEQLIYRTRQDQPFGGDVLLHTSHTPRWNSSQQKDTRFIGGTFLLNKGDHISVCISLMGDVSYREESSFVGLVMMSSVPPSSLHTGTSSH